MFENFIFFLVPFIYSFYLTSLDLAFIEESVQTVYAT